jgi:hypothetical protein
MKKNVRSKCFQKAISKCNKCNIPITTRIVDSKNNRWKNHLTGMGLCGPCMKNWYKN